MIRYGKAAVTTAGSAVVHMFNTAVTTAVLGLLVCRPMDPPIFNKTDHKARLAAQLVIGSWKGSRILFDRLSFIKLLFACMHYNKRALTTAKRILFAQVLGVGLLAFRLTYL